MNYKKIVLNQLLDKYEKSKALYSQTNRRIILKMEEIKEYNIEDYEAKKVMHDTIFELKQKNIIEFSWQPHENGNIMKEIWLNKEAIEKAYEEINRKDIKQVNNELLDILKSYEFRQEWIKQYKLDMQQYLQEKHKTNNLFPADYAKDILRVLTEIDKGENYLKRVLSIRCFNDSKYFEKYLEHIIIRIVKKYLLENIDAEELTNEDILLEIGISKYPEIIEFCGDLEYYIKGEKIECKKEVGENYINSYNVDIMTDIKIKNATTILFIENKANYIDYIENKKRDDEFVVYHGGMYSPTKGRMFKKIYEAGRKKTIYHWSDIDIGGFRIFVRLKKIIPTLKPYKMDKEALYSRLDYWQPMTLEYKAKLKKLKEQAEYEEFYDVIDMMLDNNCKLEQEAFI